MNTIEQAGPGIVLEMPPRQVESSSIFDKAVCLSLELHRLGTKRKMAVADLKPGVETDADSIHVSKDILASPKLDAIKKADGALRSYLAGKTSAALFRNGVYMLAYAMVDEVDREVSFRLAERANILVPDFMAEYETEVEKARARLGVHFRAAEYPAKTVVEATFSAGVQYFTLGSPQGLEKIRADIFERETEKAAAQWAEVLDESRNVLRVECAELVDHMVTVLEPDATGKTKRFHASTVEKLDAFLVDFGKRNIANDTELQQLVDDAREALQGITPQRLRDSRNIREGTRANFTRIREQLSRVIVTGARRYVLED